MAVSIIVVSWNTKALLKSCLRSLSKFPPKDRYDVWVVDNGSTDGSAEMVKKNFPRVKLITNKENLGFARANNQALRKVGSKYVLFLNSDTKITKGALDRMIGFMDTNAEVAACGPRLVNPDGSTQHLGFYRRLPSIAQAVFFYTDLYRLSIKNKFLVKRFWESEVDKEHIQEVEQIPGAALLIRRDVLGRIGFFDEGYPFWLEDVDLCFRLRKEGERMFYLPQSQVVHIGGASLGRWSDRANKEARFWKSLLIFFDKNKSHLDRVLIRVIIHGNLWFQAISRSLMQLFSPKKSRGKFIRLVLEVDMRLIFNKISLPGRYV